MKDSLNDILYIPRVSICLMAYDQEKYISDALKGILNQTYKNIELVILDDASNDNTVKMIEKELPTLERKFKSIKFIKHNRNTGNIAQNSNEMIKESSGEFIKFVGADDILAKNCVTDLVKCFFIYPNLSVAYASHIDVDDNYRMGDPLDYSRRFPLHKESGLEKNTFKRLMNGNFISAVTALIRRKVYEEHGLYDENISTEDYEFWLRIAQEEEIYFLNKVVTYYRRSENSLSNYENGNRKKKIDNMIGEEWKTLKKYFLYLNDDEERCSKIEFYKRYLHRCRKMHYYTKEFFLLLKLKKEGGSGIEYDENKEKNDRITLKQVCYMKGWLQKEIDSPGWFEQFLKNRKCSKAAVYGLGCMGGLVIKKLESENITIQYIIDRAADRVTSIYPVYTLDNVDLGIEIDMVIVTIVEGGQTVKKELQEKYSIPIVMLDEMIFFDS